MFSFATAVTLFTALDINTSPSFTDHGVAQVYMFGRRYKCSRLIISSQNILCHYPKYSRKAVFAFAINKDFSELIVSFWEVVNLIIFKRFFVDFSLLSGEEMMDILRRQSHCILNICLPDLVSLNEYLIKHALKKFLSAEK